MCVLLFFEVFCKSSLLQTKLFLYQHNLSSGRVMDTAHVSECSDLFMYKFSSCYWLVLFYQTSLDCVLSFLIIDVYIFNKT